MTKRFFPALYLQKSFIIPLFFFFTFLASIGLALPEVISHGIPNFLLNFPLTSSLIIYNYYSFIRVSYAIRYLPFSKYYPVILYGQCILCFGVTQESQLPGAVFLGVLSALMGIIVISKLEMNSFEKQDRKDRFFFHDMINHLYGLSLRLTYRVGKGQGFESHELEDMLGEVMALQSLMTDHFGYKHKDIQNSLELISFTDLRPFITAQISSFLDESCHVCILHQGVLDSSREVPFDQPKVQFTSFYRVFTNLLKNAREANAHNVEIIFDGDFHALSVTMKNDFKHLSQAAIDLNEGLSRAIAGDTEMVVDYKGLGLAAIENLCLEQGGSFSFEIKDGLWISYFRLNYAADITDGPIYEDWVDSNYLKVRTPKAA